MSREKRYLVLGDIHGSFKRIRDFYKTRPELDKTENILILLGDVGANFFFNYRDENFKEDLGRYPFTYFCIRGNHEERPSNIFNIDEWHMEVFDGGPVYVENKYPYIKYAVDYPSFYMLNDKWGTLTFPGAFSVDKEYRLKNGWSWFKNEMLTEDEMKHGKELVDEMMKKYRGCDIVLSHTCPTIYEPTDLFISGLDQSKVDKTMERYLNGVEYELNYKLYLWGHYHQTRIYPKVEDKQCVMLFDDYVFDLDKYMKQLNNPYDCLMTTWKIDSKGIKVI